ncbi:hypothetical protein CPB86DRAFT_826877 [Serendipita vermifera]|nr:hypothetical protein CPB86DRAFT_826877 [Serendipita vermifera]
MSVTPSERPTIAHEAAKQLQIAYSTLLSQQDNEIPPEGRLQRFHDLDAGMRSLRVRFKQLWIALLQERNRLSPIACLPSRVLESILGHCGMQTALVASSVCRHWRSAALGNPALWTTVDMTKQWYSNNLIQMQLSRSGNLPLQVHFDVVQDSQALFNLNVPDSLSAFIHRADSISGALASTLFRADMPPTPRVRSLHLILDKQSRRSLPFPHLLHFSVNCMGWGISYVALPQHLVTLHLINTSETITSLLQLLESLPRLEEFALDGYDPNIVPPTKPSKSTKNLHPLQLLCLKHISLNVVMYLIESTPLRSSITNLYIEPFTRPLPPSFPSPVTSISIDFSVSAVVFKHGETSTKLVYPQVTLSQSSMAINVADPSSVESLFWTGGGSLSSAQTITFKNLKRLEFDVFPTTSPSSPETLTAILNAELAIYCPQLHHLGINLRCHQTSSEEKTVQDARDRFSSMGSKPVVNHLARVILDFLESWAEFNQQAFPHLEIGDETGSLSAWKPYYGTIEAQVGRFQLGAVTGEPGHGHFPNMRSFHHRL